jgi:hypothetical protein
MGNSNKLNKAHTFNKSMLGLEIKMYKYVMLLF